MIPQINQLFETDKIENWTTREIQNAFIDLSNIVLRFCAYLSIPLFRFPALSYLYYEIEDFLNTNEEKIHNWVVEELFTGLLIPQTTDERIPTLLEKFLELRVQYPSQFTEELLKVLSNFRMKIIKGRTWENVYILEMDIVGSGRLTNEEKALYGAINLNGYLSGVHVITGGFTLIKEKIKYADGYVFSEQGDGILAAFDNVKDAVWSAYILQTDLRKFRDLEYRIGIGKGNLCVMEGKTRYSFSIVETSRVASRIRKAGVLLSQNCFCDLVKLVRDDQILKTLCQVCQKNKSSTIKSEQPWVCKIINDPTISWPINIPLRADIKARIISRGLVQLKHTTHAVFELLIGDEPWVIL